jgi:hypothetical protein
MLPDWTLLAIVCEVDIKIRKAERKNRFSDPGPPLPEIQWQIRRARLTRYRFADSQHDEFRYVPDTPYLEWSRLDAEYAVRLNNRPPIARLKRESTKNEPFEFQGNQSSIGAKGYGRLVCFIDLEKFLNYVKSRRAS